MIRVAFVLMLLCCAVPLYAETLESLDVAIRALDQQSSVLQRDYDHLRKQNDERRARIQAGTAAETDVRLAYTSASRLEEMNGQINQLSARKQQLCSAWRALYVTTVDGLLASAEKETDPKKKAEAGRHLQHLQNRNNELCPENMPAASLHWQALSLQPYDGPQEIAQKAQLLKDIDREIALRLARLDDRYRQAQKERRTRDRAQEFIQEGTLFDQSVSLRTPGEASATSIAPAAELKAGPDTAASASTLRSPDLGGEWQFNEDPKKAENEYRAQRDELLHEQKDLKQKIQEFEEKARSLLHP